MAHKLQNPRLKEITFHTFRHWKATTEYAKTKDLLHVMKLLGHKDIKTILIFKQLIRSKVTSSIQPPRKRSTKPGNWWKQASNTSALTTTCCCSENAS